MTDEELKKRLDEIEDEVFTNRMLIYIVLFFGLLGMVVTIFK